MASRNRKLGAQTQNFFIMLWSQDWINGRAGDYAVKLANVE